MHRDPFRRLLPPLAGAVLLALTFSAPTPALAARIKPTPGGPGLPPNGFVVQGVETRVVASGLSRPTGIVAGDDGTLFFTEIPSPGRGGGNNGVSALDVASGEVSLLHQGEPEPVNIAIGPDGSLYWSCKSAGVILRRTPGGDIAPLLTDLEQPSGISVDRDGDVWFTLLPTPGVPGSLGGLNTVNRFDGASIEEITLGEPEPTDIVVGPEGDAYWTCRSAGVILHRTAGGEVEVLLSGLEQPVGIALGRSGETLYFTEVPTPALPGSLGGRNRVSALDLANGRRSLIDVGDPEPTDITVAPDGTLYWTCSSAGVIVEAKRTR